jgi:hypothetical protein
MSKNIAPMIVADISSAVGRDDGIWAEMIRTVYYTRACNNRIRWEVWNKVAVPTNINVHQVTSKIFTQKIDKEL